jgi:hypothetical protein
MNRPPTPQELAACRREIEEVIESDHVKLANGLGQREVEFALKRPKLERDREGAIEQASAALAAYEKEIAPKVAEKKRHQAEHTAKLEADLKGYDANLGGKLAAWEKAQSPVIRWLPLEPTAISDTNGATFAREVNGVVYASGNDEPGVINFVAETALSAVTGVRLEMLPDPRLPQGGPGRAPGDGNFVVNELQISAAPKSDPKQAKPVVLQTALADFSQASFDVAQAIDGKPTPQKGWAVAPAFGVVHWATFETKEPVGGDGGTILTFKLHHRFGKGFMPGRFRISVTKVPKPVGLGLPEPFRAIIATAPELRTEAQREMLASHFRAIDPERRKKVDAVNQSKAPLPEDPGLKPLRDGLAEVRRPVPLDPKLAQLRQDVEMSIKQAAFRRLTAAQDIAWALINSPAFLFNH